MVKGVSKPRTLFSAAVVLAVFGAAAVARAAEESPLYLDPKQPIAARVEDLLGRMTLDEKIGQLNLPCAYVEQLGKTPEAKMEAARRFAEGTYTTEIGPGSGFFTLADTIHLADVPRQVNFFNELQKIALTRTRLKIPLLEDEEGFRSAARSTCRW
jgi:beta-glucosidase